MIQVQKMNLFQMKIKWKKYMKMIQLKKRFKKKHNN